MRYFIIITFFLGLSTAFCQNNIYDEVTIASPEAAILGKFTDIPVNYHTGTPNINIPIYTIKEGTLELPISLSYHASGIKVSEPSSWVGTNWALNAGGVITRIVNGAPDERNTSHSPVNSKGHYSDGGFGNYVTSYTGSDPKHYIGTADWQNISNGIKDGEPDMFSFNFLNYSGKFYFRDDKVVEIVPEQDLVIQPDYVPGKSIQSFKIIIPDGTKFYFGKTDSEEDVDPIEYSRFPSGGVWQGSVISSWFLNKIESVNSDFTINFSYEKQEYGYHVISTFPVTPSFASSIFSFSSSNLGYSITKMLIEGVRINQIEFTEGTVSFIPGDLRTDLDGAIPGINICDTNDQAYELAEIRIENGNSTFCKSYRLEHSYFEDVTTPLRGTLDFYNGGCLETDRKRLKLDRLTELSCDLLEQNPPYEFSYYDEEIVSRRLSFARDHWDYNNGQPNEGLIPTFTINFLDVEEGANRSPAWPEMRAGSLKSINYPTGASSTFEFEPHETNVDYFTKELVRKAYLSAGYDGSIEFSSVDMEASSNSPYRIQVNVGGSWNAFLDVYGSESGYITGHVLAPDETHEWEVNYSDETITYQLRKEGSETGNGAELSVYQITDKQVVTDKIVGGLRIKRLTQNDGFSTLNDEVITSFEYRDINASQQDISSGQLYGRPTYVQVIRNDFRSLGMSFNRAPIGNEAFGCISPALGQPYYKSPGSVRPLESTQGNHIGYSRVKVSQSGNGYQIFEYYGDADWSDDIAITNLNDSECNPQIVPNYPEAPALLDPWRGKIKRSIIYDESGSLKRSKYHTYDFQIKPIRQPAMKVSIVGNGMEFPTFYELLNYTLGQENIVTTEREEGIDLITTRTVYYASSSHNQATQVSRTSADGTLTSNYKYALDIPFCNVPNDCLQDYENNLTDLYHEYDTKRAACENAETGYVTCADDDQECNNQVCKVSSWHEYQEAVQNARVAFAACQENYYEQFTDCLDLISSDVRTMSIKEMIATKFMNPVLEESKWRNAEFIGANLNDYTIAGTNILVPDLLKRINPNVPGLPFAEVTLVGNSVDIDPAYETETDVKYDEDVIVEIIRKDGVPTSYLYGHDKTRPIIKAVGVTYQSLISAYNNSSYDREVLRDHSSMTNAQITTYYYNPLYGVTQIIDPNKESTTYEYDKLGRLVEIRDDEGSLLKQYDYQYRYTQN